MREYGWLFVEKFKEPWHIFGVELLWNAPWPTYLKTRTLMPSLQLSLLLAP